MQSSDSDDDVFITQNTLRQLPDLGLNLGLDLDLFDFDQDDNFSGIDVNLVGKQDANNNVVEQTVDEPQQKTDVIEWGPFSDISSESEIEPQLNARFPLAMKEDYIKSRTRKR